jgi:rubrerythrin
MKDQTTMGMNRTGIDMSPIDSKEMIAEAEKSLPSARGNEKTLAAVESEYIAAAEPIGSVPIPGTLKGLATSSLEKLSGDRPEVFIDKLGERLAFERTGTRLYTYLITKCQAEDTQAAIPIDELKRFQDEEARHFKLVAKTLESLGADPTVQTPGADTAGVASLGILQVLSDPRTSVSQSLEAILTAELTDNAGWQLLIKLAEEMGIDHVVADFRSALAEEDVHLARIRQWHEQAVLAQASMRAA